MNVSSDILDPHHRRMADYIVCDGYRSFLIITDMFDPSHKVTGRIDSRCAVFEYKRAIDFIVSDH